MIWFFKKKKKDDPKLEDIEAVEGTSLSESLDLNEALEDTATQEFSEPEVVHQTTPKQNKEQVEEEPIDVPEVKDILHETEEWVEPSVLLEERIEADAAQKKEETSIPEIETDTPELLVEEAQETSLPEPTKPVATDPIFEAPSVEDVPIEGEVKAERSWLARLTTGLKQSSSKFTENITAVITKKKLDDETLEELEEALIMGDIGPVTAAKLTADLSKSRFGKEISEEEIREFLANGIADILRPVAKPLELGSEKPYVILFCGVNGAGKTTTIGKLAKRLTDGGKTVMMAAGDTFRAAAVEQLRVWGERAGCEVISKDIGADAGALAFEAMQAAIDANVDVLLIDTAGRLQNKSNLMEELQKIERVIKKRDENAPHQTLLVLDATTGQNAHSQVDLFGKAVNISGLIVTKLDGSAKGGVIVSLADKFEKPIHAIGVGEDIDDLQAFNADEFARSLMGVE